MSHSWFYRDPAGNVQGPFKEENMRLWYNQNYFKPDLLIKRDDDADFLPLNRRDPSFTKPLPLPSEKVAEETTKEVPEKTVEKEPEVIIKPIASVAPVVADLTQVENNAEPKETEKTSEVEKMDIVDVTEKQPEIKGPKIIKKEIKIQTLSLVDRTPQKRKLETKDNFAEPAPKKLKTKPTTETKSEKEEQWIYLDNKGNIQGPFPTTTMRGWYEADALHENLPLKLFIQGLTSLTDKLNFTALKDYGRCAFTIPLEQIEREKREKEAALKAKKAKKKKKKPPSKWYYKDPEGTERGPYTIVIMRQWFSKGYIPLETPVRGDTEKNFTPISQKKIIFEDKDKVAKPKKKQSMWTYIDDDGNIQGPFEKSVLKSWHEFGWLPYDIRVLREGETNFIPWGDRIKSFNYDTDEENEIREKQNASEIEKLRPKTDEAQWYYKDDSGAVQGPFSGSAMRGWFEEGFFLSTTVVKQNDEEEFIALGKKQPQPDWTTGVPYPDQPLPGVPNPSLPAAPKPMIAQPNVIMQVPQAPAQPMAPQFQPAPQPPQESMWFYMARGDKAVGPFPLSQIRTWHREGHFNDRVKVSRAQTPDQWKLIVNTECAHKPQSQQQNQVPQRMMPNFAQVPQQNMMQQNRPFPQQQIPPMQNRVMQNQRPPQHQQRRPMQPRPQQRPPINNRQPPPRFQQMPPQRMQQQRPPQNRGPMRPQNSQIPNRNFAFPQPQQRLPIPQQQMQRNQPNNVRQLPQQINQMQMNQRPPQQQNNNVHQQRQAQIQANQNPPQQQLNVAQQVAPKNVAVPVQPTQATPIPAEQPASVPEKAEGAPATNMQTETAPVPAQTEENVN